MRYLNLISCPVPLLHYNTTYNIGILYFLRWTVNTHTSWLIDVACIFVWNNFSFRFHTGTSEVSFTVTAIHYNLKSNYLLLDMLLLLLLRLQNQKKIKFMYIPTFIKIRRKITRIYVPTWILSLRSCSTFFVTLSLLSLLTCLTIAIFWL